MSQHVPDSHKTSQGSTPAPHPASTEDKTRPRTITPLKRAPLFPDSFIFVISPPGFLWPPPARQVVPALPRPCLFEVTQRYNYSLAFSCTFKLTTAQFCINYYIFTVCKSYCWIYSVYGISF